MKHILIIVLSMTLAVSAYSQNYNQERVALRNFLVRLYKSEPFEGVKVVSDYNNNYLLSIVLIANNGQSESIRNRIAQVKSQRQVSVSVSAMQPFFKSLCLLPLLQHY